MLAEKINDYKEYEQEIIHWVNIKGEYRYNVIIEFLKKVKIDCSWKNITNYVKYDKRILINSFKYIVFLEELFKSFIKKYKNINQKTLLKLGFEKSIEEFLSIGSNAKYDNIDLDLLEKEKKTIVEFRNSVVHNKILLNRVFNKKSLSEVLQIFAQILPESYREGYLKDINYCSKGLMDMVWFIKI